METFFKETVQVTLPVTDNLSGVEKLEYRLPGEDGYTAVTLDQTVSDERFLTFLLEQTE